MTIAMFAISVPVFDRRLKAHSSILEKTKQHAAAEQIDEAALMADRLYSDMFPFWLQVHSACDHATNATARLTGIPLPVFDETARTFDGLKARVAQTLQFVNAADPATFDGAEERVLALTMNGREQEMTGLDYFLNWALPNFYFHLTTAYGILRRNGVEIGKRDFMGNPA